MMSPETMRKAAILVSALDREAADSLLDQFESPVAETIRSAVMSLDGVASSEERHAISEFLGQCPATSGDSCDTEPRASVLDRASERLIADCLCDELPQTIAVALSQLPTRRASEVVGHLPAHVQAQVLERLVEYAPSASLELADIRDEFQQWLNHQIERSVHLTDLAARLATILDATSSGTRQRILANVSNSDARLAQELRCRLAD